MPWLVILVEQPIWFIATALVFQTLIILGCFDIARDIFKIIERKQRSKEAPPLNNEEI